MSDLTTIDPATLQPGDATDRLICELLGWTRYEPCEPEIGGEPPWRPIRGCWKGRTGFITWMPQWSTYLQAAAELRMEMDCCSVIHRASRADVTVVMRRNKVRAVQTCNYAETDGNKLAAESLATCRAFVELKRAGG
jgi:hypothetical protein